MKHSNIIENDRIIELNQILRLADLAKFAKFKPLPNENDLSMKNAFSLIENTIPEIEEHEEENQIQAENELLESVNSKKDV